MINSPDYFYKAKIEWNLEKLCCDLANAKTRIFPHKKKELTPTETLHLSGLLSGNSPSAIAQTLFVKPQGLNVTLSNTLYRYVEELTQHPINSINNWREVVDWLEAAGYKHCTTVDWGGAPDVAAFYGRESELSQLKQWIFCENSRLVGLFGMGGIGKTALSVALVEQIKDKFEYVVWRSLRDMPRLDAFISELFCEFSSHLQPIETLSQLFHHLQSHRCLIVLDELEGLLKESPVGHYRQEYENYGNLLEQIGSGRHQSCVITISREKPKEFRALEGNNNPVYFLLVGSLRDGARCILKDQKLLAEEDKFQKLIQLYGGNPLALKLVSATIQDLFDGNINQFLKQDTTFIDSELRDVLDQQFARLSDPETEVVRQLATHPQPVPISSLREAISGVKSCTDSIQVIEALRHRSLLEKVKSNGEALFTLHPIVLKYAKRVYR